MIQELLEDIIGVEVPEGAKFSLFKVQGVGRSFGFLIENAFMTEQTYLPDGNWQLLFTSENATDEDCSGIVDVMVHMENFEHLVMDGYCDYTDTGGVLKTAVESFKSLLQSKGLKGNCAILKKQL